MDTNKDRKVVKCEKQSSTSCLVTREIYPSDLQCPSTSGSKPKRNKAIEVHSQKSTKTQRQNRRRRRIRNFAQPLDDKFNDFDDEDDLENDVVSALQEVLKISTPKEHENDTTLFKSKHLKQPKSGSDTVDFVHSKNKSLSNPIRKTIVFHNRANEIKRTEQEEYGAPVLRKPKKEKQRNKSDKKRSTPVKQNKSKGNAFKEYYTLEQVEDGLANGTLICDSIRINQRCSSMAFVRNLHKNEMDVVMLTVADRNRAFDGDIVVVKLKGDDERSENGSPEGFVVYIKEKVHPRVAVGIFSQKSESHRLFQPRDKRLPRIRIPNTDKILVESDPLEEKLFLARITKWDNVKYADGELVECIGEIGELHVEVRALLLENGIDADGHSLEEIRLAAEISAKPVDEEVIAARLDLRDLCIFTIDPETAKDLDDALSCVELPDGSLEIGVHIADVSHYLEDGTFLDKEAQRRGTSVYMVDHVKHMLPVDLCMQCSLLPGLDRLTFSVIWRINPETCEVLEHKFARTVIRTCAQLSYEHAQSIIDKPEADPNSFGLPEIKNGFTQADVTQVIRLLHALAMKMRSRRYENGALRIDQPKICFRLDKETKYPTSFDLYVNKESHQTIEEFMLLANITVAEKLCNDFPKLAFLRSHPAPTFRMMNTLARTLEKVGIHLDVANAGSLQRSLKRYTSCQDEFGLARSLVLNTLCARPMARAIYFCLEEMEDCHHYALNIPLYTHFTSPIRRYADIMVHRLLAASIQQGPMPDWTGKQVSTVATHCNKMKYWAKRAGEQCIELYMGHYIGERQPMIERAVVVDVKDNSFDAIVISSGITVRVYLNTLPSHVTYVVDVEGDNDENDDFIELDDSKKLITLTMKWNGDESFVQTIALFSIVTVSLSRKEKTFKIEATLMKPE